MSEASVSVIMPAYNECASIYGNVIETARTLDDFGYNFEIIVVDDGSSDRTCSNALRAKEEWPDAVRVVSYDRNQGKGNALIAGVLHSRNDYVVFLDSDMELHPDQLPRFFALLERERVDAVIGSKFHPASNVTSLRYRRILSSGYYRLVRLLFGLPLRDTQTGLKVFRRAPLLKALPFTFETGFAFDIELLAIMDIQGARVTDAPVTVSCQRQYNRLKLSNVASMLAETFSIFFRIQRDRSLIKYIDRNGRAQYSGSEQKVGALIGRPEPSALAFTA